MAQTKTAKKTTKAKRKISTLKKKVEDRSWILPPNTISKKTESSKEQQRPNYPTKISYWVDQNGEAQLYTPEQLAICNILMNLNVLLNKSLTLAENIKNMEESVTVGTLAKQDYAQFKDLETSVYGHFVELLAASPDITFGEFLNFISSGNDTKAFLKMGKQKLKKIVAKKSPDVTQFYSSDSLRKSKKK